MRRRQAHHRTRNRSHYTLPDGQESKHLPFASRAPDGTIVYFTEGWVQSQLSHGHSKGTLAVSEDVPRLACPCSGPVIVRAITWIWEQFFGYALCEGARECTRDNNLMSGSGTDYWDGWLHFSIVNGRVYWQ
jgi:hypothetical protein